MGVGGLTVLDLCDQRADNSEDKSRFPFRCDFELSAPDLIKIKYIPLSF